MKPSITYRKGRTLAHTLSPSYPGVQIQKNWLMMQHVGFHKCGHCIMCQYAMDKTLSFSYNTHHLYQIASYMNCQSTYCVYAIVCPCGQIYVGSTIRSIQTRVSEHWRAIRMNDLKYPITVHANSCVKFSLKFHGVECVPPLRRGGNRELMLRRKEAFWIMKLKAVSQGLNFDHEMHYFLGD